jgi:hypothetical protein
MPVALAGSRKRSGFADQALARQAEQLLGAGLANRKRWSAPRMKRASPIRSKMPGGPQAVGQVLCAVLVFDDQCGEAGGLGDESRSLSSAVPGS